MSLSITTLINEVRDLWYAIGAEKVKEANTGARVNNAAQRILDVVEVGLSEKEDAGVAASLISELNLGTASEHDAEDFAPALTTYTKTEVDNKVSALYRFMGSKDNFAALPSTGQAAGDVWNLLDTGMNYAWTDSGWDALGNITELATLTTNGLLSKEDFAKLASLVVPTYQTITLVAVNWSTYQQTIAVTGVTANNNIIVSPNSNDADYLAYGAAVIRCTSQGAGTLTFKCTTVPTSDIAVNIKIQ